MRCETPAMPSKRISIGRSLPGAVLGIGLAAAGSGETIGSAHAAVVLSSTPTKNMSCSAGVCVPTAKKAVLNVGDLADMLQASDVAVTTGSGALSIEVRRALSWASAHTLSLTADSDISIEAPVTVAGPGGLVLAANNANSDGDLLFTRKGRIAFWDLSSSLVIGGDTYVLAKDVKTLASDISGNRSGHFALADNYDASADGTFNHAPIFTLAGTVEGLGNAISNLTVSSPTHGGGGGLFGTIQGTVRDIGLVNANISGGDDNTVGGLVVGNLGTIRHAFVTGSVTVGNGFGDIGGLTGYNEGTIADCYSAASVQAGDDQIVGGLVGENFSAGAVIVASFATGAVSGGDGVYVGGLIGGNNIGTVSQSYARGSVSGGDAIAVGGLAGFANQTTSISESYSTGLVSAGNPLTHLGGLIGQDMHTISLSYWDLDTSGVSDPTQGAGNIKNDAGITGLTTAQFQSGLPAGFNPAVWREKPKINNGYPYLVANPPAK
jgi:hypothetical protein